MPHIFDPQNKSRLDNPERKRLLPASKILRSIGLKKGDILLDIGAGTGFFTLPALKIVGSKGKVIATDVSEEMLTTLKTNVKGNQPNLELLQTPGNTTGLKNIAADVVFMAFVLHEVADPAGYIEEVKGLLKAGGKLAILEWEKKQTPTGPPEHDRLEMTEVVKLLHDSGLIIEKQQSLNPYQYMVVGRKQ
jgi:ubiquinone/menaquinone biosynthesis C-methylase UbiE